MKKSWKLILIALLAALLVCTCMSALADASSDPTKCDHPNAYWKDDEKSVPTSDHAGHVTTKTHERLCPDCGTVLETKSETESKTHDYEECFQKSFPATCTADGYDLYKCPSCSDEWQIKTVSKLPHKNSGEGSVEWMEGLGGCMAQNWIEYDCTECGQHIKEKEGEPYNAHQYEYVDTYKNPTCQRDGWEGYVCKECGDKNNVTIYPKLDHVKNFMKCVGTNYTVAKEATCTEGGEMVGVCQFCQANIRITTEKAGHKMKTEVVKKATCTESGISRAVCSNPLCNYAEPEYVTPPSGHDYEHAIKHVPNEASGLPNCTKPGTATYYEECPNCHAVLDGVNTPIPALGHKYEPDNGSYAEQVEVATCTSYGLLRVWCARCDDINAHIDVQIPMIAHVHSDAPDAWTTSKDVGGYDATCVNTGLAVNLCLKCHGDPQTKVVPKKDHDYFSAKEAVAHTNDGKGSYYKSMKAATCTAAGSVEVYCKYGCMTTKTVSINPLNHDWVNVEYNPANKVPTCTKAVTLTRKCQRPGCNAVETIVITPALGHLFEGTDPRDKAPTCTEEGIRYGECKRDGCDAKDQMIGGSNYQILPALGHKDGKPVVTAATCTAEGKSETKCERCGLVTKTEVIPKTAHTPVDKVVTEATTKAEGLIETRCSVCGTLLGTKAIPKKPSSSSGSGSGSSSSGSGTGSAVVSNVVTGTINAAGVSAAELGATSTAMVTPLDLSVDGTYTYSLVANGQYVVGTVTFVVSNGTFSASYTVNPGVVVSAPSLVVFANVDALKAGTATTVGFNAIFDGAGDTKVIAAVTMVGTFSTTSATPYVADAAQVAAMKAIVD